MLSGTTPSHEAGEPNASPTSGRRRAATPESRIRRIAKSESKALRKAEKRGEVSVVTPVAAPRATARGTKKPALLNLAVMAVVVPGLFCTVALPAYAFQDQQDAGSAAAELQALKADGAQTVKVGDDVVAAADIQKLEAGAHLRGAERGAMAAERAAKIAAAAAE